MDFSYTVEGLDDVNALLKKLPENLGRKAANTAVRAASSTIRKAIRDRIRDNTGNLRRSIKVRKEKDQVGSTRFTVLSTAPHAHLVEYGTSPHLIKAGEKKSGKSVSQTGKKTLSDGSRIFGRTVQHPGAQAKPFFRPAIDESAERAIDTMREVMARAIVRAAETFIE